MALDEFATFVLFVRWTAAAAAAAAAAATAAAVAFTLWFEDDDVVDVVVDDDDERSDVADWGDEPFSANSSMDNDDEDDDGADIKLDDDVVEPLLILDVELGLLPFNTGDVVDPLLCVNWVSLYLL